MTDTNLLASTLSKKDFFPINLTHLEPDNVYPFDIYAIIDNHFVLIRPKDTDLTAEQILQLLEKKHRKIWIPNKQRNDWNAYLSMKILSDGTSSKEKAMAIKETAWNHIADLYNKDDMKEVVSDCHMLVTNMIDYIASDDAGLFNLLRLSAHDYYTYNHSLNVSVFCIALARKIYSGDDEMIFKAGLGGLLHDIGKRKVSSEIINKPGKLTEDEWDIMKKHPGWGKKFLLDAFGNPIRSETQNESNSEIPETEELSDSGVDELSLMDLPPEVISVVYQHHENCDGTGYPENIGENEIHPLAKIGALADVFDALTTDRSYSKAMAPAKAMELMVENMSHKFDKNMFKIFKSAVGNSKKPEEV